MSKAIDMLPPIRLLETAEETVGKTVIGAAGFDGDDGVLFFSDGTALAVEHYSQYENTELRTVTEMTPQSLASDLRLAGLLSREDYEAIQKVAQAESRAEAGRDQIIRERAEYKRLRMKFGDKNE